MSHSRFRLPGNSTNSYERHVVLVQIGFVLEELVREVRGLRDDLRSAPLERPRGRWPHRWFRRES